MTEWDPRADHVGILDLVEINTTDGPFHFMLGQDGPFTDVNGVEWLNTPDLAAYAVGN